MRNITSPLSSFKSPIRNNKSGGAGGGGGGAPASGYRYWRLKMNHNWGKISGWGFGLAEWEIHSSIGGANVTGSGTSSSDAGTSANAFDNNGATSWEVNKTAPHYLNYDFGAGNTVDILEFVLKSVNSGQYKSKFPDDFDIEFSEDGITYTFLNNYRWAEPASAGASVTFTVTPPI